MTKNCQTDKNGQKQKETNITEQKTNRQKQTETNRNGQKWKKKTNRNK